MSKEYSYKAINQDGIIIYLSKTSDYDFQEQTENEYFITDNYCIIEECYNEETEETESVVIMKKSNGIVQKFGSIKTKKPVKLKVTFTNGDVEIINRLDFVNRFDITNLKYGTYEEGHKLYDIYCVKLIEALVNKASKTGLGSSTIDSNLLSDITTRALEILN